MVDLNSFYSETRRKFYEERKRDRSVAHQFYSPLQNRIPELMDRSDQRDFASDCPCHICKTNNNEKVQKTPIFHRYDNITRKATRTLTNHQYFLCAKQIDVFIFKTRTWGKREFINVFLRKLTVS